MDEGTSKMRADANAKWAVSHCLVLLYGVAVAGELMFSHAGAI